MERRINKIIIHCSDTPFEMYDIGVEEIRKWHLARGWRDIGYHYVIKKNGFIGLGRNIEKVGAHCRGQNSDSIGICWVGGADGLDDRTKKQKASLKGLIKNIKKKFGDHITVHGHSEFSSKSCPNFDVKEEFKQ